MLNEPGGLSATIYVPAPGSRVEMMVDPGSGIVGRPGVEGGVMIYYEGNRFGAENMREWQERARHAAGRMFAQYPTIAKAWVSNPDELVAIGEIRAQQISDIYEIVLAEGGKERLESYVGQPVNEADLNQRIRDRELVEQFKRGWRPR